MCPITHDTRYSSKSGRPALLQRETFARLTPLFPTLLKATLSGLGEPTIHPHLDEFVGKLADAGVETSFTTNPHISPQDLKRAP